MEVSVSEPCDVIRVIKMHVLYVLYPTQITQKTRGVDPILFKYWADVKNLHRHVSRILRGKIK